jgi:hypothetical protein
MVENFAQVPQVDRDRLDAGIAFKVCKVLAAPAPLPALQRDKIGLARSA